LPSDIEVQLEEPPDDNWNKRKERRESGMQAEEGEIMVYKSSKKGRTLEAICPPLLRAVIILELEIKEVIRSSLGI
jgi:hypothetical protein